MAVSARRWSGPWWAAPAPSAERGGASEPGRRTVGRLAGSMMQPMQHWSSGVLGGTPTAKEGWAARTWEVQCAVGARFEEAPAAALVLTDVGRHVV